MGSQPVGRDPLGGRQALEGGSHIALLEVTWDNIKLIYSITVEFSCIWQACYCGMTF